MQTDATLLANNSQQFWMLHVMAVCTPCYMLLGVAAQCLKPVKPLNQQLPTFLLCRDRRSVAQQRWIRLHSSSNIARATHAYYALSAKSYGLYPFQDAMQVPALLGVVAPVCKPLPTRTPQLPTLLTQHFLVSWSLRLHDYDGHCPKAVYVLYRTSPKEYKFHFFCKGYSP